MVEGELPVAGAGGRWGPVLQGGGSLVEGGGGESS